MSGPGPEGRRPDRASETRLRAIRDEARRSGRVGGAGVSPAGAPFPVADAAHGYYGLPPLKPPTWTWEVPAYFFVGGAAGAAAVIGLAGTLAGRRGRLTRDARWIAVTGGAISAALLTSDLGRPERFLYMLRVFKRQSAMSVGAWILSGFSTAAGAAAFADAVAAVSRGRIRLAFVRHTGDALAGVLGLGMCTYTGVLIGATAVPAWNRNVAILPVHFGASALASGVALLEVGGHRDPALRPLALLAATVESLIGARIELSPDAALEPLRHGPSGWLTRLGGVLSGPVPLLLRALPGGSARRRRLTAWLTLAGTIVTRFAWVRAGAVSTRDSATVLESGGHGRG